MPKLIFLLVIMLLTACASNQNQTTIKEKDLIIEAMHIGSIINDSIVQEQAKQIMILTEDRDIAIADRNMLLDSIIYYRIRADSIEGNKLISDYKIARIQHYINICSKESNKKYLYGWIRRVLAN